MENVEGNRGVRTSTSGVRLSSKACRGGGAVQDVCPNLETRRPSWDPRLPRGALSVKSACAYRPGMLVDTHRLHSHLNDPKWVIFDCRHDLFDHARGAHVYSEGHLPGAHFVPVESALAGSKTGKNGRHPLPDPEAFAGFLARHGVTKEAQIVAYDDVGGQYAARLWWLARWIGLSQVGVLDGGWAKWVKDGYSTTAAPTPRPAQKGTVTARPDPTMVLTADEVLAGVPTKRICVVDARAPERFRGETEPLDPVAGHIPSARNRFFKLNLNPDLTLRPAVELKREFAEVLGTFPPADVVHQCGSGVTACANLLAMEHAGLPGSRLYVGSWSEWVADPTRPVARGS